MILLMEEILHQLIGLTWFNPLFVGFQPCKVQDFYGFLPSTVSPGGSQLAAVNSSGPSCTAKPCTAGVGPLSRCTLYVAKRGNQWEWGIATPQKWKGQIAQKWWQVNYHVIYFLGLPTQAGKQHNYVGCRKLRLWLMACLQSLAEL